MDIEPVVEYYGRIMMATSEDELKELEAEVQTAVLKKELTDSKEIVLLSMAIQVKTNFLFLQELAETATGTTIMVVGNTNDFDPEQMQLDEFKKEEYEDFKDGNVISIKDLKKKD